MSNSPSSPAIALPYAVLKSSDGPLVAMMFSLYIADTTRGWSHTTTASLAGAARSSAEVIIEAPCCTFSGGTLPLADFGTINITSSMANGGALGNAGGVTEIIMVDRLGRYRDTVSQLSGGENFSATWLRSN